MIPNLKKNDLFWEGTILLKEWVTYFGNELELKLNIGGDCIVDEINETHENAFNYLLDQQLNIIETAVDAFYFSYNSWQREYGYDEDEKLALMPNITCKKDLIDLIAPRKIYILDIETDNIAYYGVEFKCRWDEEHGLGLMMHKNRIVKVGGADTAFMSWIAEEDTE